MKLTSHFQHCQFSCQFAKTEQKHTPSKPISPSTDLKQVRYAPTASYGIF